MNIVQKADLFLTGIANNFSVAEIKAFITVYLVPLFLIIILKDVVSVFIWLGFCVVMYSKIKVGTENGRVFFVNLQVVMSVFLLITIITGYLIVL